VFIEQPVGGTPGLGALLAKLPGKVFAQQRVGIQREQRVGFVPVHREQLCLVQPGNGEVAMRLANSRERLGQVRDCGSFPQSFEAAHIRRPVEQPQQPQKGEGTLAILSLALEPPHIGIHDAESVAALFYVGFL
jgi:hypothetical protein